MATEFQITDLRDMDQVEAALTHAGKNEANEQFRLYVTKDAREQVVAGLIRIEGAKGGYDVGRVHMTVGSFPRPVVVMTTFNSCRKLTGRALALMADDDQLSQLVWEAKKTSWLNQKTEVVELADGKTIEL